MSYSLPNSVTDILRILAEIAMGYGNRLKWNEVDKLKADLMNAPARWKGVPVEAIEAECRRLGMRDEDVSKIVDLVRRAQAGKKLRPDAMYKNFRFEQPIDQATSD